MIGYGASRNQNKRKTDKIIFEDGSVLTSAKNFDELAAKRLRIGGISDFGGDIVVEGSIRSSGTLYANTADFDSINSDVVADVIYLNSATFLTDLDSNFAPRLQSKAFTNLFFNHLQSFTSNQTLPTGHGKLQTLFVNVLSPPNDEDLTIGSDDPNSTILSSMRYIANGSNAIKRQIDASFFNVQDGSITGLAARSRIFQLSSALYIQSFTPTDTMNFNFPEGLNTMNALTVSKTSVTLSNQVTLRFETSSSVNNPFRIQALGNNLSFLANNSAATYNFMDHTESSMFNFSTNGFLCNRNIELQSTRSFLFPHPTGSIPYSMSNITELDLYNVSQSYLRFYCNNPSGSEQFGYLWRGNSLGTNVRIFEMSPAINITHRNFRIVAGAQMQFSTNGALPFTLTTSIDSTHKFSFHSETQQGFFRFSSLLPSAATQNLLTLHNNGNTLHNTTNVAFATTATPAFTVSDTTTTNALWVSPSSGSGSYNSINAAGTRALIAGGGGGTQNNNAISLTNWCSIRNGVRASCIASDPLYSNTTTAQTDIRSGDSTFISVHSVAGITMARAASIGFTDGTTLTSAPQTQMMWYINSGFHQTFLGDPSRSTVQKHLIIAPSANAGVYNSITQANDTLITARSDANDATLTLTTSHPSIVKSGLRIRQGVTEAYNLQVLDGGIKFADNTVQTTAAGTPPGVGVRTIVDMSGYAYVPFQSENTWNWVNSSTLSLYSCASMTLAAGTYLVTTNPRLNTINTSGSAGTAVTQAVGGISTVATGFLPNNRYCAYFACNEILSADPITFISLLSTHILVVPSTTTYYMNVACRCGTNNRIEWRGNGSVFEAIRLF